MSLISLCLSCTKPQAAAEDHSTSMSKQQREQAGQDPSCPTEVKHQGLPSGTQAIHKLNGG